MPEATAVLKGHSIAVAEKVAFASVSYQGTTSVVP
jgi:hypothetical protein